MPDKDPHDNVSGDQTGLDRAGGGGSGGCWTGNLGKLSSVAGAASGDKR